MEAHNGSISAYSAGLHQGSSFTLQFPSMGRQAASPRAHREELIAPLMILLVEDHEDSRECLSRLLEMRGHDVVSAENGQNALQFGRSCSFDLLVTDIGLPDLNGLLLLEKLRETQPGLVGVTLGGHAMPLDGVKSREAGYLAHLNKPVSIAQMDDVIREVAHQLQTQS